MLVYVDIWIWGLGEEGEGEGEGIGYGLGTYSVAGGVLLLGRDGTASALRGVQG